MSTLEFFQCCPTQRKALLDYLGAIDPLDSNIIHFDLAHSKQKLHHRIAFQIQMKTKGTTIHHCVVDEGASTCIISLTCWKALGSPTLVPSGGMLKALDAHTFKPHKIILAFPITLKGKTVEIEIEVIDAPVDYNLLLGRSWTNAMLAVVSIVF